MLWRSADSAPVDAEYRHVVLDLLDPSASLAPAFAEPEDVVVHLAWCVEHGNFWTTAENLDWIAATFGWHALLRAMA